MLHFHKIRWKNFLSTGDTFTEIQLDAHPTTLIVGQNGAGKSTLLDALSFALFGWPHRDIKKPQLINTVNNRDCLVEVEFEISSVKFKVIRGMRPGIFEIWQNGVMINQESHSRDYQKVLEQNILKLNHKSFHQIVILGSSSFIPFMQLPTQHRREVIEDLLDINIFTKMNQLLKEKSAKLREMLGHAQTQEELVQAKLEMQSSHIAELEARDAEVVTRNREKIAALQAQVDAAIAENDRLHDKMTREFQPIEEEASGARMVQQQLQAFSVQINSKIQNLVKEARFYEENNECPTCAQPIMPDFKTGKMHVCRTKAKELMAGTKELDASLKHIESVIIRVNSALAEADRLHTQVLANSVTIRNLQEQIREIESEVNASTGPDLSGAKSDLDNLNAEMQELRALKNSYYQDGTYNNAISEMLKDTGIKTKVIRQYLPVMNKLINGYLSVLDFFVSFNLDENFEETIKSRHRDDFTYASFSEGEKSRIDLALLFTWRQIARMKNSTSTNLLVLDETFDSSLDADGVENLTKILGTLEENTNVFIISHKTDALDGKFSHKLTFVKDKNFSTVRESP